MPSATIMFALFPWGSAVSFLFRGSQVLLVSRWDPQSNVLQVSRSRLKLVVGMLTTQRQATAGIKQTNKIKPGQTQTPDWEGGRRTNWEGATGVRVTHPVKVAA